MWKWGECRVGSDELMHWGIPGQKWGIRRFQNKDGSLTEEGKRRYSKNDVVFISGSSKTQDKESGYYRRELPKEIRNEIDEVIKNGSKVVIGDAPGIDHQVQDYLNKKNYANVEVYGPGENIRYTANKNWKANPINDVEHEPGSKEWLAKKDKAMTDIATVGIAVILDEGSSATKANVQRLTSQNKDVKVFSLNRDEPDGWISDNKQILPISKGDMQKFKRNTTVSLKEAHDDIENLPSQITEFKKNRLKYLNELRKNGMRDPQAHYDRTLKYMKTMLDGSRKEIKFDSEMAKYFQQNKTISPRELISTITKYSKKYNMNVEWVMKYYAERFPNIFK